MSKLKKNYVIQKRNVLNEIRSNSMTLQELRFFSIYLSRINADNINTRVVRFPMEDFRVIMELGRMDMSYIGKVINSLLCKIVNVPSEDGGFTRFQLFKECTVGKDDNGEWYVEIDAHDKALPLMFEFKSEYFTYRLWNALRLKSSNQLRMYEVLKQYQAIGYRIITLSDLKELLGINKKEYPRFDNFKTRVLDACQQALEQYTDIKFTCEPHGKKGRGGKVLSLKFNIMRNEKHADPIGLDTFISNNKLPMHDEPIPETPWDERMVFLKDSCDNEFSEGEIKVLINKVREVEPAVCRDDMRLFHYLNDRYIDMARRSTKTHIKSRFAYVKSLIGQDV